MINNKTSLNMVIGYPLEHSQSPILHNTIYQALKLNTVLLAFPCWEIQTLIQAIKTLTVSLTAVTMPFKEEVMNYLDSWNVDVEALQAVNTIIQRQGKLIGYNTDVDGIAYALRTTTVAHKNVLIIGAGGAARALAYFLQKNNAHIFWLNRTPEKAEKLSNLFGGELINRKQINDLQVDIIINTTPVGMYPQKNANPLENYLFNYKQTVFDMVYNPTTTELLQQAQKNGAKIISGLDMFIGQGIRQIELWLDTAIDKTNLVKHVREKLQRELIS